MPDEQDAAIPVAEEATAERTETEQVPAPSAPVAAAPVSIRSTWSFPEHGVSVEASSLEEATQTLHEIIRKG